MMETTDLSFPVEAMEYTGEEIAILLWIFTLKKSDEVSEQKQSSNKSIPLIIIYKGILEELLAVKW